jgi:hypothetical protein
MREAPVSVPPSRDATDGPAQTSGAICARRTRKADRRRLGRHWRRRRAARQDCSGSKGAARTDTGRVLQWSREGKSLSGSISARKSAPSERPTVRFAIATFLSISSGLRVLPHLPGTPPLTSTGTSSTGRALKQPSASWIPLLLSAGRRASQCFSRVGM